MFDRAERGSWGTQPIPALRRPLLYSQTFTAEGLRRLSLGLIPQRMEDKWFVVLDEDWLLFYRSWTGYCIYGLRIDRQQMRVVESWVSNDPEQYDGNEPEFDREMVHQLVEWMMSDERFATERRESLP